jgi:hypothetical protein
MSRLGHELRRHRPTPSDAFARTLEARVAPTVPATGRRLRLAVAAGFSAVLLAVLGAFGGIGYAALGVSHAVHAVAAAVQLEFPAHRVGSVSAAADQYGRVTLCHNGHEILVTQEAVPAHLAQGDTFGKCPVYAPPVRGGSGGDTLNLGSSGENRVVVDLRGDNKIQTGRGDDKIRTGGGNDVVNAGKGANRISTGGGNDTITSGGGRDTIFAGTGDDTIFVRDGNSDFVNCGPGRDIVYADPARIDYVAANCEIVHRARFRRR